MKARRKRRSFGADTSGMTAEDRKAMQTYRTNRGSRRYYEDLDAINSGETVKPKTNDQPK
jgi:hypothetical protein